jgi:hypothetical protein
MVYVISWRRSSRVHQLVSLYLLHAGFLLGLFFSHEDGGATYSSEISVVFQQTTRRCIPKGRTLHNHRREDLRSHIYENSSEEYLLARWFAEDGGDMFFRNVG